MKDKTIFYGEISGEREVPTSSGSADDVLYSACVKTNNILVDLLREHAKNCGRSKGSFVDMDIHINYVDTEDEDKFVEWKGEYLFPVSGRVLYNYLIDIANIPSFMSTLPTTLNLDGDTISIDWRLRDETL